MTQPAMAQDVRDTAPPFALDRAAIERLRGFGGNRLLAQMIDLFVATGRQRLDAARSAAFAHDCGGVRAALHALKSSAGQIGATTLQDLCERGEAQADAGMMAGLTAVVSDAYEQYIVAVRLLQHVKPVTETPPDGGAAL